MTGTPTGNSVSGQGTQTAPGSGVGIANIAAASLAPGLWHVAINISYGATAGLINDFSFKAGGTTVGTLNIQAIAGNQPSTYEFVRALDGATSLAVQSITGGVVSSIYNAQIIATPIRG